MALNATLALDNALFAGEQAVEALAGLSNQDDRIRLARAFGVQAIASWWELLEINSSKPFSVRPLLQPFPIAELSPHVAREAARFAAVLATLDVETAAHVIGKTYTEMLPAAFRSTYGVFYTPPVLTERLIDLATEAGVTWASARVLDPACGGGAFLAPVAQRIMKALPGCSPRILLRSIAARLRGYEIDPFAAWLSQVALDAILLPLSRKAGEQSPAVVTVCDSLKQLPSIAEFDLVIGNPPYGKVRLSEKDRARFKRGLYGHANLYGLFTDIALRHAKAGAVVAYVTPTSFLAGQYFKNLRTLIAREAPPVAIDFVDARKGVFDNVLQETLLATYVVGQSAQPIQLHTISPTSGTTLSLSRAGTAKLPPDSSQPWLLPRRSKDAPLVERLVQMLHRLADWGYEVSTGPLVWNRHKDQLVNEPGPNRRPLIWAEAVSSDGQFVYPASKRNHAPYFEVRSGDEWLVIDKPCVLLQRTTAKEQSRRLIAAHLPESFLARVRGSVVIENHVNMIRALPGVTPAVSASTLTAFLNSAAADRAFRCVSGSVAVSAFELESLPLPSPFRLRKLAGLIEAGAAKARIEAECARLYAADDEFPTAVRNQKDHCGAPAPYFS
jgi:adenine-specific DNA-methyltransferase